MYNEKQKPMEGSENWMKNIFGIQGHLKYK